MCNKDKKAFYLIKNIDQKNVLQNQVIGQKEKKVGSLYTKCYANDPFYKPIVRVLTKEKKDKGLQADTLYARLMHSPGSE